MNSTSLHNINADNKISRTKRYLWFILNWLNNNLFPNAINGSLQVRNFKANISNENWNQTNIKSSPSRKLSDLFLMQLPWKSIQSELININILDTGCGSGNFSGNFYKYSKINFSSYTGFDTYPHDNWKNLLNKNLNIKFRKINSNHIYNFIPENTNLFITQSAIEHFKNDLLYFEQIHKYIKHSNKSIIQIHLFPSSACLKLYLLHGIRQYNQRSISYISRLF